MTHSTRRAVRSLAAPFLVTVALVPACAKSTQTDAQEPTTSIVPTAEGHEDAKLPEASNPDAVQKRDDGTCWEVPTPAPPCPPDVACNPPPPRQVRCPG